MLIYGGLAIFSIPHLGIEIPKWGFFSNMEYPLIVDSYNNTWETSIYPLAKKTGEK